MGDNSSARAARQKRMTLEKELGAARSEEQRLVRPMAASKIEELLDDLEIAFCNGGARKQVIAAMSTILVHLLMIDKVRVEDARSAIDAGIMQPDP